MSTNHPSMHPDGLQAPEPGMTATAKVFVWLGIAGGLVTLTACAAVIVGLMERAEMADVEPIAPNEHVARALRQPGAQRSKRPVVLTPSLDRFAVAPEEPDLSPKPQDAEEIARDRTRVTLQARFVELDLAAAAKLAGDAAAKSGMTDGGALLESLAKAQPEEEGAVLGAVEPADLVAALPDLQKHGVARVLAAPKVTTQHRVPAKVVEEGRLPVPAEGAEVPPRLCSATLLWVPEVLGRDELSLELSAQISVQGAGEQARPQTTSAATRVQLRDGQTLAIGGTVRRSSDGTKYATSVILVTAQVQAPVGPEAQTPLTEAEVRQRRGQQCRFVEEEIARQFPESKVELVAAAGKLFVRGTAKDEEQLAGIMAVVRRRVDAWQIVGGPAAQTATPRRTIRTWS